jgi:hypothetical protein
MSYFYPTKFELKIAKILCDAQGDYAWKYLKDVRGNSSTAYAYYDYIEMAQKVIKKLGLRDAKKPQA